MCSSGFGQKAGGVGQRRALHSAFACLPEHLPTPPPSASPQRWCSPRGDDLDTRLLRAMVVKGILEQITTSQVGWVWLECHASLMGERGRSCNWGLPTYPPACRPPAMTNLLVCVPSSPSPQPA